MARGAGSPSKHFGVVTALAALISGGTIALASSMPSNGDSHVIAAAGPATTSESTARPVRTIPGSGQEHAATDRVPDVAIPRVGVYGDSTALGLAMQASSYKQDPNRLLNHVGGITPLGCGITMSHSWCKTAAEWGADAAARNVDIAVVYVGVWETECLKPFDEAWTECHHAGEQVFDDYLRRHLSERTTALLDAGVEKVVYMKMEIGPGAAADRIVRTERWDRWYELVDEFVAGKPDVLTVEMRQWFRSQSDQRAIRHDGLHYATDGASRLWKGLYEEELYWKLWYPLNSTP